MKATNEKAVIQLLHAPTGEYVDWLVRDTAVPSVYFIDQRVADLREQMDVYIEDHKIDLDSPSPKPSKADKDPDDESTSLSAKHFKRINEFNRKIVKLKLDALSSILTPAKTIPAEYDSSREFLEQCISGPEVIPAIMDFFWKHTGNSTELPVDSRPPIRIVDRNGEEWESPVTRALRKSKPSSD